MSLPLAPFATRLSSGGMVAAADHLAASAGVTVLSQGGSGADAAIATAAVMAVVGPHMSGLGGDMLAMVSVPGEPPMALLGIGRAGSGVDPKRLRAAGHLSMPLRGDLQTVPVPGAVDGWLALWGRFGRLPLEAVLGPAIELAERGFPASIMLALASHLIWQRPGTQELCADAPLSVGQLVRLPGIGRTLRAIAAEGRDGFYGGEFGRGLLALGQGVYAADDFATDQAQWCTPVHQQAWGHDLWTVPPPSQGYLTLAGSVIAEACDLGADPDDADWIHLIVEACRAAGFDRPGVLYDGADGAALIDRDRLLTRVDRIGPDRTAPSDVTGTVGSLGSTPGVVRMGDGDTTHVCAIDADGLGVSLTQSNALDFGSHVIEPTTGVFLQNRGVGFSLEPGHPAELAPGRRPPHTLSPMLATRPDGTLSHLVGAMGGDAQPQILVQLLARLLRAGQDPASAISAPRVALDAPSAGPFRLWWGDDLRVQVEANAPTAWTEGLAQRGHQVQKISAFDPTSVGCAQIIAQTDDGSGGRIFLGASDPRSPEGAAVAR